MADAFLPLEIVDSLIAATGELEWAAQIISELRVLFVAIAADIPEGSRAHGLAKLGRAMAESEAGDLLGHSSRFEALIASFVGRINQVEAPHG